MRRYARNKQKPNGEEILWREQGEGETGYVSAPLLTVGEAAMYLGVSRKTIYRMIETGQIRTLETGSATLVEEKSLDEFHAAGVIT